MTSLTLVGNTPSAAITDNQAFSALLVDIKKRARSGEFDRLGYIAQDVIDAFKTLGVYRALVPRRFGGDQCSPGEFCAMVEEIPGQTVLLAGSPASV